MSEIGDLRPEEIVRRVLADHAGLGLAPAELELDSDLWAAGMTSLASVGVMLALEDAFSIEFPGALLVRATFATIESIVTAIVELPPAPTARAS